MTSATSSSGSASTSTRSPPRSPPSPTRLPQILDGIPLRLRSVLLDLDRPNFTLNPTNCDPFAVDGHRLRRRRRRPASRASTSRSPTAPRSTSRPSSSLPLRGGTKRRGHPALHAVLQRGPGEANSRRIVVTLPNGELLDNAHIGTVCTRVQFAADALPRRLGDRQRHGGHPAARPAAQRARSTCAPPANKLPDLVIDLTRPVRHRARRPRSTASTGRPADHLRGPARRAVHRAP